MAQHNEKPFEAEPADYLQAYGWRYSEYGSGYDTQSVILPESEVGLMRDETSKIAGDCHKFGAEFGVTATLHLPQTRCRK